MNHRTDEDHAVDTGAARRAASTLEPLHARPSCLEAQLQSHAEWASLGAKAVDFATPPQKTPDELLSEWARCFEYYADSYVGPDAPFPSHLPPAKTLCVDVQTGARLAQAALAAKCAHTAGLATALSAAHQALAAANRRAKNQASMLRVLERKNAEAAAEIARLRATRKAGL